MLHTKTFYLTRLNKFGFYHKHGLMPLLSIWYLRFTAYPFIFTYHA